MELQNSNDLHFSDQESYHSRYSSRSLRSLDRISIPLTHRSSLNSNKSIVGEVFPHLAELSQSAGEENYRMFDESPIFVQDPIHSQKHSCQCQNEACCENNCPCILALNESCNIGLCCAICVQRKTKSFPNDTSLLSVKPKQKNAFESKCKRESRHAKSIKKAKKIKIQKEGYDFVYCTCKKTQCRKKYCPCFALNKECNECCVCEGCQNCSEEEKESDYSKMEKKENEESVNLSTHQINENGVEERIQLMIEDEIDNYFQDSPDNYDDIELNRVMDFDPVDFYEYQK